VLQENRWGRLPITIYPADYTTQVDTYSFDMSLSPGRTYRYYKGNPPIFSFGYGLSLTEFRLKCASLTTAADASAVITIECEVANVGRRAGDDILMVFHRLSDEIIQGQVHHPTPIRALVDFTRVTLNHKEAVLIRFDIPVNDKLAVTDDKGDRVLYSGVHILEISDSGVDDIDVTIHVKVQANGPKVVLETVPQPDDVI